MPDFKPPSPPYLGPAAHTSGPGNKPINRIVIHSTVSPCVEGGARSIAAYFRSSRSGGSAHYVVDPGEVVQVVYDSIIAWHAPPNTHSLGIEMCEYPAPNKSRWGKPNQQEMLKRTARLTAQLCLAYNVPPRFVGVIGLRAGRRGITTHNMVSKAWHQSTHWDPGGWPRREFMREVRRIVKQMEGR